MAVEIEHLHLEVNDQRLYAAAAGPPDGPLVVLLHGFPEMSYGWRRQLAPLAEAGLRVVAPDQRGYGWSSKPTGRAAYALDLLADDIVALARRLGRDRACLVGHDWGGVVAWVLAATQPAFVERAAILNAPHPGTLLTEVLRRPGQALRSAYIAFFQIPWLPEAVLAGMDFQSLERSLTATSRPGTFTEAELAVYRKAWAMQGALTSMLNWYRAMPLAPEIDKLPVTPPVRLIWGDRDTALDPDLADLALARCRHGELFHLPEAGHWLHHEEPEQVNRLLIEFLQG